MHRYPMARFSATTRAIRHGVHVRQPGPRVVRPRELFFTPWQFWVNETDAPAGRRRTDADRQTRPQSLQRRGGVRRPTALRMRGRSLGAAPVERPPQGHVHSRDRSRAGENPTGYLAIALSHSRAEEARYAKAAAETANVAKSQFLANMSHELRTPMNAIMGMTDLALGEELSPRSRDYLQTVKQSADGLLELVNEILDLSRIEAGGLPAGSDALRPPRDRGASRQDARRPGRREGPGTGFAIWGTCRPGSSAIPCVCGRCW